MGMMLYDKAKLDLHDADRALDDIIVINNEVTNTL